MGVSYQAVGWNRQKKRYDTVAWAGLLAYLITFLMAGSALFPSAPIETLLIRALGTAAFLLLHIILLIGPLCRVSDRFLPLLYNRRHLGVSLFILALAHVAVVVIQYHAFGPLNPLVSILSDGGAPNAGLHFQLAGLAAFMILLAMAVTSHDFWLRNLTAPAWKALHMLVYLAYLLLIAHVAFGILHQEQSALWLLPVVAGAAIVGVAHALAAWRETGRDQPAGSAASDGFLDVCALSELPGDRGRTFVVAGERVAVYRYEGQVSAVSNACQHQNGPLGEGRIIDGCIVCPWHGYQYDPATGCSPPPFTEKVPTFRVRIQGNRVQIHEQPLPPGTPVTPAAIPSA